MKEILTSGNITKDFDRLGIEVRQTYDGDRYGVCEVTNEEFDILCDDSENIFTWENCGWRYCVGSNLESPEKIMKIKGRKIVVWNNNSIEEYDCLLSYLCNAKGCSTFKNICALTKDLAKYNNMKLSELFSIYQG